jgi:SET domain-containing protein
MIILLVLLLSTFVVTGILVFMRQQEPPAATTTSNKEDTTFLEDRVERCDMCTEFSNTSVYVSKSKYKGRGVFAAKHIKANESIELCPILLENKSNIPLNNVMTDYVFSTGPDGEVAFSMGYCGLFNHDDHPNARWVINRDKRTVEIIALRNISKGEEMFVSYGEKYWNTRNIKRD